MAVIHLIRTYFCRDSVTIDLTSPFVLDNVSSTQNTDLYSCARHCLLKHWPHLNLLALSAFEGDLNKAFVFLNLGNMRFYILSWLELMLALTFDTKYQHLHYKQSIKILQSSSLKLNIGNTPKEDSCTNGFQFNNNNKVLMRESCSKIAL